MESYPIPMVPGPVKVPQAVLDVYQINYGSGDLEPEFLELYNQTEAKLQQIFATQNSVIIQTGEGMAALWGALKSCLKPGDRVLVVATGLFGYGFADMTRAIGAEARIVGFAYNETLPANLLEVEQAIVDFNPKMITAIHCETPSGTLNPLAELGRLKQHHEVPLLCVDVVASLGGSPVLTDEWHIDLCLGGSQKCLSVPPSMSLVAVSPAAWEIIERVDYAGYDALKPFREAQAQHYFPYTPNWAGVAALNAACDLLLKEGLTACFARHEQVAAYCRQKLVELSFSLFPAPEAALPPLSPPFRSRKAPPGRY